MKDRKFIISIEPSSLIPNLTIITLAGNLDLSTSQYVDEKVLPFIEKGESNIIIDLSQLEYLSSIGMMSLTQFQALLMKKIESLSLSSLLKKFMVLWLSLDLQKGLTYMRPSKQL